MLQKAIKYLTYNFGKEGNLSLAAGRKGSGPDPLQPTLITTYQQPRKLTEMNNFEIVTDFDDEVQEFMDTTHGGSITGICLSENNDAIALKLEDGRIIEFRADGSLIIADPEDGVGSVLKLRNEEMRLAEMAFWGFGRPLVGQ